MYLKMIEEEECPICLVTMNEDEGILIMDCCDKRVHLECVVKWYTERRTLQTCFLCNQSNKFSKSILSSSPIPPNPLSHIIVYDSRTNVNHNNMGTLETSLVNNPNIVFIHRFPCLFKYGQYIIAFGSVISFLSIA